MRRVLLIGLDGFEISLAEAMMAEGLLPHMSRLRSEARRFRLDHGDAKYSGLAWEHFSSGLSPQDGGRSSAVAFDPENYLVKQMATTMRPFLADVPVRTVAFDLPYCDLSLAPTVRGVAQWGAHDPGVPALSRPGELGGELDARFGSYPAKKWIYGFTWPSAANTKEAANDLEQAVHVRAEAAKWLLGERLPDWDLGIVVVSEPHSAHEQFWHGVDPSHPLHRIKSGPVAGKGLRRVYCAVDALIGTLRAEVPHAAICVFAMHGMGGNDADLPAMALLPELLYRHAFGKPYMRAMEWPLRLPSGVPLLPKHADWGDEMQRAVPWGDGSPQAAAHGSTEPLAWMPATRYRHFWPRMPAFALPAFYDGRIRINLTGREATGLVAPDSYAKVAEELVHTVAQCRNAITGEEVVSQIRATETSALELSRYDADIHVRFRGAPVGLTHPTLGLIGPLPYRRTGGHTGDWGFLYIAGDGLGHASETIASSFDVVPTAIALLGVSPRVAYSGTPLLH